MPDPTVPPGYEALRQAAAWVALPGRSVVDVTGPEAVAFVNRFATNALAGLEPGTGAETFFTDARGWVLVLATALRTADGMWIDADAGLAAPLAEHLEHYHIRERLEIADHTAAAAVFVLAGPGAAAWLAAHGVTPPASRFHHDRAALGGHPIHVARGDWVGDDSFLVRVDPDRVRSFAAWLAASGLPEASSAAADALRIESGRPAQVDMPEKTLPQELCRDARAISFTKGCYLGQETVARIDALGHVNRRILGVAVAGMPRPGAEVRRGDELLGTISSACFAPRINRGLGLALLRSVGPDQAVRVDGIDAVTLALPLPPSRST